MTNCPLCGKVTDTKLDRCVHCGGPIQRPKDPQRVDSDRARSSPSQTCPNCHALVQEGDIICVACGTNLLTGQKILTDAQPSPSPSASVNWKPWIIGLVIGLVLLAVLALLIFLLSRDAVAHAERLVKSGQTIQATDFLRTYTAKRPDDARAHFLLGKLLWNMDVTDGAADAFEKAARLDTSNEQAALYAILCYLQLNDNASLTKAATLVEQLINRSPTPEAYLLKAHIQGARGNLQDQVQALSQALRLDPNNFQIRVLLCLSKATQGDLTGAQADLDAGLKQSEASDPLGIAVAGLLDSLKGQPQSAVTKLTQAINAGGELKPRNLLHVGALLLLQGESSQAQKFFEQVLQQEPNNALARLLKAICFEQQRAFRDAIAEYDAVSRTNDPLAGEASVQLARLYLQMNEVVTALEASDKALQLNINNPVFHTIRGRILAKNGQFNEARESFRNALKVDPSYPPAHLENGLLFIQLGQLEEGIRALKTYLELVDPSLPDARVNEVRALVEQLEQAKNISSIQYSSGSQSTRS